MVQIASHVCMVVRNARQTVVTQLVKRILLTGPYWVCCDRVPKGREQISLFLMDILPSPASIFTPPTPSAVHTPFKTPCTVTACPSPVWDIRNCVEGWHLYILDISECAFRFLLRGYIHGYLHTTHRCARESIGHPTEPHCLAYVLFLFSQKVICVWWSKSLPKISSKSHFVNGTGGVTGETLGSLDLLSK